MRFGEWWEQQGCNRAEVEHVALGDGSEALQRCIAAARLLQQLQRGKRDERSDDLEPNGVRSAPQEPLEFEVLLDPFEKQFDLPAALVERGDLNGFGLQIIGQEYEFALRFFAIENDPAQ